LFLFKKLKIDRGVYTERSECAVLLK